MTLFARTVSKYRDFIASVLEKATGTESGKRIMHAPGLTMTQLHKLTPLLKPKKAVGLYAAVYGLPEDFFDASRIAAIEGDKTSGPSKTKGVIVDVPPVKGGTNRHPVKPVAT